MAEFSVDKRDIKFALFEWLKVQDLSQFPKFEDFNRELLEMTVDEATRMATEVLAPTNAVADAEGAQLVDGQVKVPQVLHKAFAAMRDGGWISITKDPNYGGQGFPDTIGAFVNELVSGASMAFSLMPLLTRGACDLVHAFGSDEQKEMYCEKMFTGIWGGTMCLTEPQAGSALADVKTIATPEGEHYKIKGSKCFITWGDHDLTDNVVHLVLARTPGSPEGTRGISLFVVPKFRVNADGSLGEANDINIGAVEHKMGIHASPTCVINFGDENNCIGHLVGELHRGLPNMFKLMNEARLEVGHQSLGQAAVAYLAALDYAKERIQGKDILERGGPNVAIIEHPDVRRNLLWMKSVVEGLRALSYSIGGYADLSHNHPDKEERQKYDGFVQLLTPICKAYTSDMAFRVTELAIQVHGGYGYIGEYNVEQYCRDVKICSLYEGTNGIQALDLLGRKVLAKDGILLRTYLGEIQATIGRAVPELESEFAALKQGGDVLLKVSLALGKMAGGANPRYAFLSATPYLSLFGGVVVAQLLLDQAALACRKLDELQGDGELEPLLDKNPDAAYYHNKIQSAKFFVSNVLPEALSRATGILSEDDSPLAVRF